MSIALIPNACAVYASAAGNILNHSGFPVRLLSITAEDSAGNVEGHCVLFWRVDRIVRAYDPEGTITLPERLSLRSSPMELARAWAKKTGWKKVIGARVW